MKTKGARKNDFIERGPYKNNLRKLRLAAGLTQLQVATPLNKKESDISRIESGRVGLNEEWIRGLKKNFGWTASDLYGDGSVSQVPLLGEVGAGETVLPFDDMPLTAGFSERDVQDMNCEFVEAPPGGLYRDLIALRVKGDSMEPNFWDGDIVYYNQLITSNFGDYIGRRVVVKLKDGRAFLKVLRKGTQDGRYRLESFNGKDIEDVELDWAAKVIFIKPA